MIKNFSFLFFCFISTYAVMGQDFLPGTWYAKNADDNTNLPFEMRLDIGSGEKQMLYPIRMTIRNQDFEGIFQFVLLKKSIRTYSISTVKFVEKSEPFDISVLTRQFTGLFEMQSDKKGNPQLELYRFPFRKIGMQKNDSILNITKNKATYQRISELIQTTPIRFFKCNDTVWNNPDADSLLQPRFSPKYMGIIDTLFVSERKWQLSMNVNKDVDIVSCRLLKNPIWDQVDSKKKREEEVVLLDTGLNILGFFADDFGKTGFSSASMKFGTDQFSKTLDLGIKENAGFTFLAQKIFYRVKEDDVTQFDEISYTDNRINNTDNYTKRNNSSGSLEKKNIKTIGTLKSRSSKLKFAIWDDAVEDGDTISIMVNGTWIASGFPVRKKTQFLEVELKPGSNAIIFQADNLGSIVPNTSVVEIIDGNKRKSYFIETDLDQMNRINILFDVPK